VKERENGERTEDNPGAEEEIGKTDTNRLDS